VESFQALKGVHNHYYCNVCVAGFEAKLDEYIAVSFTVNPGIREIAFHHPEQLSPRDYFFEFCASPEGRMPDGTPFVRAQESVTRHVTYLEPGETDRIELEAEGGVVFAVSHGAAADLMWMVEGKATDGPHSAGIVFTEDNRERGVKSVAPGRISTAITNATSRRDAFMVALLPPEFAGGPPPLTFAPFLSGKRLITTQTFRRLYRSEVIEASEGIGIADITLLFTDLKGSTALYDRIGDLNAFSLVQQHFSKLQAASIHQNGAIIKTIGDAVMAAFLQPADAVRSALEMQEEIDDFNRGQPDKELVLKIGIHTGPAIAVTLNDRLDYFGQTVNIAARVQDLADADEIFISEDVFGRPDVAEILAGSIVDPQVVRLKGVHHDLQVFRVRRAHPVHGAGGENAMQTQRPH